MKTSSLGGKIRQDKAENIWNKIYEKYDGPDALNRYIYSKLIKILRKYVDKHGSILEAGCGSGYLVSYFQNRGYFSVGLDCYSTPLNIAKYRFKAKNLVMGDIFNLPFKDSSFDLVWNEGVLEHFNLKKSIEAVNEMVRVSKKYVVIDVPNRYSTFTIEKIILKLVKRWQYGYEESYTPKRLKYLMENAGLKIIDFYGVCLLPPLPKKPAPKLLKWFSNVEKKYPKLTKMFGYHLIAVGKKLGAET